MANPGTARHKAAELMEQAASLLDEARDAVLLMRIQHAIDTAREDEWMPPEARYRGRPRDREF